ncbi:hypothetical protein LCGC14_1499860 [marine sediment metagenome]|uniref:Uncharacterized protein n=1 Tax=marine sediment metagenome TaxID=412755 RepID=A0A0F9J4B8_9ZZZZ
MIDILTVSFVTVVFAVLFAVLLAIILWRDHRANVREAQLQQDLDTLSDERDAASHAPSSNGPLVTECPMGHKAKKTCSRCVAINQDDWKQERDELREELAKCKPSAELEYEKTLLLELLGLPQSQMDNADYLAWYACVQKTWKDAKDGKRGILLTARWDEHPEGFDVPCLCALCRSYGD